MDNKDYKSADYNTNIDIVYDTIFIGNWNILNLIICTILSLFTVVYLDPLMLPIVLISCGFPFVSSLFGKKKKEFIFYFFSSD